MFTQSAYSDPDIMRAELKTYMASKHANLGWPQTMVNELVEQVDISFDEADSFFKFDETIVRDALRDYQEAFIRITVDFTGNPNQLLKNYQKVLNTISSLIETQYTVDQLSGLELAGNVAQDQIEEFSEKQEKARDDALQKYIPWVLVGVGAYFILPRIVTSYVRK